MGKVQVRRKEFKERTKERVEKEERQTVQGREIERRIDREREREKKQSKRRCDFYQPYHFGELGGLTSGSQAQKRQKT